MRRSRHIRLDVGPVCPEPLSSSHSHSERLEARATQYLYWWANDMLRQRVARRTRTQDTAVQGSRPLSAGLATGARVVPPALRTTVPPEPRESSRRRYPVPGTSQRLHGAPGAAWNGSRAAPGPGPTLVSSGSRVGTYPGSCSHWMTLPHTSNNRRWARRSQNPGDRHHQVQQRLG